MIKLKFIPLNYGMSIKLVEKAFWVGNQARNQITYTPIVALSKKKKLQKTKRKTIQFKI